MTPPMYVGPLSDTQRQRLDSGLRSRDAFALRRCQILRARARGERPSQRAAHVGCTAQTVRHVLRAARAEGAGCLRARSSRPKSVAPLLDAARCEPRRASWHESPRAFGKPTSLWTLALLAKVCGKPGLTPGVVSLESSRRALQRMPVRWKRAQHWITRPAPRDAAKKKQRDRLMRLADAPVDWVRGFADEVWGSGLAQLDLHAWAEGKPRRLQEMTLPREDTDPKAVACYGMLRADPQAVRVRFVDGRPVSPVTTAFLHWVGERLAAEAKTALLLVWDHASWHWRQEVRGGLRTPNRQAKRAGGVRLVVCQLPLKSPWLNRIEPHGIHAKRAVVEPGYLLSQAELISRICAYFNCQYVEHLQQVIAKKVA